MSSSDELENPDTRINQHAFSFLACSQDAVEVVNRCNAFYKLNESDPLSHTDYRLREFATLAYNQWEIDTINAQYSRRVDFLHEHIQNSETAKLYQKQIQPVFPDEYPEGNETFAGNHFKISPQSSPCDFGLLQFTHPYRNHSLSNRNIELKTNEGIILESPWGNKEFHLPRIDTYGVNYCYCIIGRAKYKGALGANKTVFSLLHVNPCTLLDIKYLAFFHKEDNYMSLEEVEFLIMHHDQSTTQAIDALKKKISTTFDLKHTKCTIDSQGYRNSANSHNGEAHLKVTGNTAHFHFRHDGYFLERAFG